MGLGLDSFVLSFSPGLLYYTRYEKVMPFEEIKFIYKEPSLEGAVADEHIIGIWVLENQIC